MIKTDVEWVKMLTVMLRLYRDEARGHKAPKADHSHFPSLVGYDLATAAQGKAPKLLYR